MNEVLYTPEAIARMRGYAARGFNENEISKLFGWDVSRIRSVANKHQIEITGRPDPARIPVHRPAPMALIAPDASRAAARAFVTIPLPQELYAAFQAEAQRRRISIGELLAERLTR